jgi:hypothetical protein
MLDNSWIDKEYLKATADVFRIWKLKSDARFKEKNSTSSYQFDSEVQQADSANFRGRQPI